MNIADLTYLRPIADPDQVTGGEQNNYFDNRAVAISASFADGLEAFAVTGTSVYVDRGVSQAQSFAEAQSSS